MGFPKAFRRKFSNKSQKGLWLLKDLGTFEMFTHKKRKKVIQATTREHYYASFKLYNSSSGEITTRVRNGSLKKASGATRNL